MVSDGSVCNKQWSADTKESPNYLGNANVSRRAEKSVRIAVMLVSVIAEIAELWMLFRKLRLSSLSLPSLYPNENILSDRRYLENAFFQFSEVVFVNSDLRYFYISMRLDICLMNI